MEGAESDDCISRPGLSAGGLPGFRDASVEFRVDLDDEYAGGFSDFVDGSIPLVSKKLRNVLESCGVSNIDYYPVKVAGAEEFDEFPEYFAANVVGLVKAAGPGTLAAKTFGASGADIIDKFVVDTEAVGFLPVFRLAEHLATLVVSDQVRTACEAANLLSLSFIPLDQWAT